MEEPLVDFNELWQILSRYDRDSKEGKVGIHNWVRTLKHALSGVEDLMLEREVLLPPKFEKILFEIMKRAKPEMRAMVMDELTKCKVLLPGVHFNQLWCAILNADNKAVRRWVHRIPLQGCYNDEYGQLVIGPESPLPRDNFITLLTALVAKTPVPLDELLLDALAKRGIFLHPDVPSTRTSREQMDPNFGPLARRLARANLLYRVRPDDPTKEQMQLERMLSGLMPFGKSSKFHTYMLKYMSGNNLHSAAEAYQAWYVPTLKRTRRDEKKDTEIPVMKMETKFEIDIGEWEKDRERFDKEYIEGLAAALGIPVSRFGAVTIKAGSVFASVVIRCDPGETMSDIKARLANLKFEGELLKNIKFSGPTVEQLPSDDIGIFRKGRDPSAFDKVEPDESLTSEELEAKRLAMREKIALTEAERAAAFRESEEKLAKARAERVEIQRKARLIVPSVVARTAVEDLMPVAAEFHADQMRALTAEQLVQLAEMDVHFTKQQLDELEPYQLSALTKEHRMALQEPPQVAAQRIKAELDAKAAGLAYANALSREGLEALSGESLGAIAPLLSTDQLWSLSSDQLRDLGRQGVHLSTEQINVLSYEQKMGLSAAELEALSEPPELTAVRLANERDNEVQFRDLQRQVASNYSAEDIPQLPLEQLEKVVEALRPDQIRALTPLQLRTLARQSDVHLSRKQASYLTSSQLISLQADERHDLEEDMLRSVVRLQAQRLAKESVRLTATQLSAEKVAELDPSQLRSLAIHFGPKQIAALTQDQVEVLTGAGSSLAYDHVKFLSADVKAPSTLEENPIQAAARLQADKDEDIELRAVQAAAVAALSPRDVPTLAIGELVALLPALTPPLLLAVASEQLLVLVQLGHTMRPDQINVLTRDQLLPLSPQQVQALEESPQHIASRIQAQRDRDILLRRMRRLATEEIKTDSIPDVKEDELAVLAASLNEQQVQALTTNQLQGLARMGVTLPTKQLKALTDEQAEALGASGMAALEEESGARAAELYHEQTSLSALKTAQNEAASSLNPDDIKSLDLAELKAIAPALQTEQLQALSTEQLKGLAESNVTLTVEQAAVLSADQLRPLSTDEVSLLKQKPEDKEEKKQHERELARQLQEAQSLATARAEFIQACRDATRLTRQMEERREKRRRAQNSEPHAIATTSIEQLRFIALDLDRDQLKALNKEKLIAMADAKITLTKEQVDILDHSLFNDLSLDHRESLTERPEVAAARLKERYQEVRHLREAQTNAVACLPPDMVGSLLAAEQLYYIAPALTPEHMKRLTVEQVAAVAERKGVFTKEQIEVLERHQLIGLPDGTDVSVLETRDEPLIVRERRLLEALKLAQHEAGARLMPEQVEDLSVREIGAILPALSTEHLQRLSPQQLVAMSQQDIKLTQDQLEALSMNQVKSLTAHQLDALEEKDDVDGLSAQARDEKTAPWFEGDPTTMGALPEAKALSLEETKMIVFSAGLKMNTELLLALENDPTIAPRTWEVTEDVTPSLPKIEAIQEDALSSLDDVKTVPDGALFDLIQTQEKFHLAPFLTNSPFASQISAQESTGHAHGGRQQLVLLYWLAHNSSFRSYHRTAALLSSQHITDICTLAVRIALSNFQPKPADHKLSSERRYSELANTVLTHLDMVERQQELAGINEYKGIPRAKGPLYTLTLSLYLDAAELMFRYSSDLTSDAPDYRGRRAHYLQKLDRTYMAGLRRRAAFAAATLDGGATNDNVYSLNSQHARDDEKIISSMIYELGNKLAKTRRGKENQGAVARLLTVFSLLYKMPIPRLDDRDNLSAWWTHYMGQISDGGREFITFLLSFADVVGTEPHELISILLQLIDQGMFSSRGNTDVLVLEHLAALVGGPAGVLITSTMREDQIHRDISWDPTAYTLFNAAHPELADFTHSNFIDEDSLHNRPPLMTSLLKAARNSSDKVLPFLAAGLSTGPGHSLARLYSLLMWLSLVSSPNEVSYAENSEAPDSELSEAYRLLEQAEAHLQENSKDRKATLDNLEDQLSILSTMQPYTTLENQLVKLAHQGAFHSLIVGLALFYPGNVLIHIVLFLRAFAHRRYQEGHKHMRDFHAALNASKPHAVASGLVRGAGGAGAELKDANAADSLLATGDDIQSSLLPSASVLAITGCRADYETIPHIYQAGLQQDVKGPSAVPWKWSANMATRMLRAGVTVTLGGAQNLDVGDPNWVRNIGLNKLAKKDWLIEGTAGGLNPAGNQQAHLHFNMTEYDRNYLTNLFEGTGFSEQEQGVIMADVRPSLNAALAGKLSQLLGAPGTGWGADGSSSFKGGKGHDPNGPGDNPPGDGLEEAEDDVAELDEKDDAMSGHSTVSGPLGVGEVYQFTTKMNQLEDVLQLEHMVGSELPHEREMYESECRQLPISPSLRAALFYNAIIRYRTSAAERQALAKKQRNGKNANDDDELDEMDETGLFEDAFEKWSSFDPRDPLNLEGVCTSIAGAGTGGLKRRQAEHEIRLLVLIVGQWKKCARSLKSHDKQKQQNMYVRLVQRLTGRIYFLMLLHDVDQITVKTCVDGSGLAASSTTELVRMDDYRQAHLALGPHGAHLGLQRLPSLDMHSYVPWVRNRDGELYMPPSSELELEMVNAVIAKLLRNARFREAHEIINVLSRRYTQAQWKESKAMIYFMDMLHFLMFLTDSTFDKLDSSDVKPGGEDARQYVDIPWIDHKGAGEKRGSQALAAMRLAWHAVLPADQYLFVLQRLLSCDLYNALLGQVFHLAGDGVEAKSKTVHGLKITDPSTLNLTDLRNRIMELDDAGRCMALQQLEKVAQKPEFRQIVLAPFTATADLEAKQASSSDGDDDLQVLPSSYPVLPSLCNMLSSALKVARQELWRDVNTVKDKYQRRQQAENPGPAERARAFHVAQALAILTARSRPSGQLAAADNDQGQTVAQVPFDIPALKPSERLIFGKNLESSHLEGTRVPALVAPKLFGSVLDWSFGPPEEDDDYVSGFGSSSSRRSISRNETKKKSALDEKAQVQSLLKGFATAPTLPFMLNLAAQSNTNILKLLDKDPVSLFAHVLSFKWPKRGDDEVDLLTQRLHAINYLINSGQLCYQKARLSTGRPHSHRHPHCYPHNLYIDALVDGYAQARVALRHPRRANDSDDQTEWERKHYLTLAMAVCGQGIPDEESAVSTFYDTSSVSSSSSAAAVAQAGAAASLSVPASSVEPSSRLMVLAQAMRRKASKTCEILSPPRPNDILAGVNDQPDPLPIKAPYLSHHCTDPDVAWILKPWTSTEYDLMFGAYFAYWSCGHIQGTAHCIDDLTTGLVLESSSIASSMMEAFKDLNGLPLTQANSPALMTRIIEIESRLQQIKLLTNELDLLEPVNNVLTFLKEQNQEKLTEFVLLRQRNDLCLELMGAFQYLRENGCHYEMLLRLEACSFRWDLLGNKFEEANLLHHATHARAVGLLCHTQISILPYRLQKFDWDNLTEATYDRIWQAYRHEQSANVAVTEQWMSKQEFFSVVADSVLLRRWRKDEKYLARAAEERRVVVGREQKGDNFSTLPYWHLHLEKKAVSAKLARKLTRYYSDSKTERTDANVEPFLIRISRSELETFMPSDASLSLAANNDDNAHAAHAFPESIIMFTKDEFGLWTVGESDYNQPITDIVRKQLSNLGLAAVTQAYEYTAAMHARTLRIAENQSLLTL